MAAKLYDLARVTTASTGTAGTITLGAAVAGFLTFALAGVQDGDTVPYGIRDGSNSEVGTGVWSSGTNTLTRVVTKSTNSNAAISLSGTAVVYITMRTEDFNSLMPLAGGVVTGNVRFDDAAVLMKNTTGATDAKIWRNYPSGNQMFFDVVNDASNTASTWLTVTRSAATITAIAFGVTPTGLATSGANTNITSLGGLTTALSPVQGGTGQTSYTIGDLIYASGSSTLSKLAGVATGNALISGGTSTAPSWGKITTSHTTGIAASGANSDITSLSLTGSIVSTGGSISLTASNAGIEIGSVSASNTPFADFHSSGNNIDYDARIIASGGTATVGAGSLTFHATGGFTFDAAITGVTAATADNSTLIATTAFVKNQGYAALAGATFTGLITTGAGITNTGGVVRWVDTAGGTDAKRWRQFSTSNRMFFDVADDAESTASTWLTVTRSAATITAIAFSVNPTGITTVTGDNSTAMATTAFVKSQSYAPLASPVFTGFAAFSVQTAASAGVSQGTATAITAQYMFASGNAGVLLPAGTAGRVVTVRNTNNSGGSNIAVYPASGESVNSLAANSSFTIGGAITVTFVASTAGNWKTMS